MEVLLVRAAVPFPCPRRSQKSGEPSEKARAQKLLTSSPAETANPTKAASTVTAAASASSGNHPQSSRPLVPLPGFPLKFPWFKAGKKDVDVARDVASLALSSAHDDVTNLTLSDEDKRTVHEVLSTLQSAPTELTALEVATLKPLGSDDSVDLAKAEAEIAKSWLHNFMRIRLWNNLQFNSAPRKQAPKASVLEAEVTEKKIEEGGDPIESVVGEDAQNCVCEECSVDTEDVKTTPADDEAKEIAHVKIVHDRASFSKFLQSVSVAELKTVSHLAFLSNLAYAIPSIKPGDLLRHHGLRFITSSVHIKAVEQKAAMEKEVREKEAREKEAREKAAAEESAGEEISQVGEPQDSLPTAEASSITKKADAEKWTSRFSFMKRSKTLTESTAYQLGSTPCKVVLADDTDEVCMECKSKLEVPDDCATTPAATTTPTGNEETKPTDAQSSRSCPCEWFICDDELAKIRNFVIQGSDSVASWQANLMFEPTQFENPQLGVKVHRGIYEAAQLLYDEILPHVIEHVQKHGSAARFRFTGHSLGGSLAILLSLLLRARDTAPLSSLLPVTTFGSPYIFCGGDYLLQQLGLPHNHVQMVVMHRDIVPRSFTCDYPDHVAEVLRRVNSTFRNYACLKKQKLLYAPMGVMRVIQPAPAQSPGHPLLPVGSGIYDIIHPSSAKRETADAKALSIELRSAHRAFLNNPHPLDILRDRSSYGARGGISRDHDPRSYMKAVKYVLKQEQRKVRRSLPVQKRSSVWWPLLSTDSGVEFIKGVVLKGLVDSENSANTGECGAIGAASSGMGAAHQVLRRSGSLPLLAKGLSMSSSRDTTTSGSTMDRLSRYSRLIASKHVHIGMLLLVSARVLLMQGLATFIG